MLNVGDVLNIVVVVECWLNLLFVVVDDFILFCLFILVYDLLYWENFALLSS